MTSRLPVGSSYRLCRFCAARQGTQAGRFEIVKGRECFVCEGAMDRAARMGLKGVRAASRFQFQTFSVGVSMPSGVQEREDEVRADLKLMGNESVKTQAARMVADQVSKGLRKRVDRMRPDLMLLADFGEEKVTVTTRPLYFYGRYTKPPGISQRRELCVHCSGRGCDKCGGTGFEETPSVEGHLRKKLSVLTGSERMTFTWLGSEDVQSRVYPPGRPFVVEVKSPVKRKLPGKLVVRSKGSQVVVSAGRVLKAKPLRTPSFKFKTRIFGSAKSKVPAEALSHLRRALKSATVTFERPNDRPTVKRVYSVSAKARGKKITIDAELDGGLPVKRFVSGELVSPSVSEVLKTEVRCRSFDICGVRETGAFELAEVSRVKKKN